MYDDYSDGFAFRGVSYRQLGKYHEAIDDFIKTLSIDGDGFALFNLTHIPDSYLNLAVAKLKAMAIKQPHEAAWHYYIGMVYRENKMYSKAIESLRKAFDIDADSWLLEIIAECHKELGQYPQAIEVITQAQQMNPDAATNQAFAERRPYGIYQKSCDWRISGIYSRQYVSRIQS